MIQWGTTNKELSNKDQITLQDRFNEFYSDYADSCEESIVEFIDSIYDQFKTKKWLSEKQITALDNIIVNCAEDWYDSSRGEGFYP